MQKGFSAPILLVSISLLIIGSIVYYDLAERRQGSEVKGFSDTNKKQGFSVLISSQGPWDFYEYICENKEECERSLTSGKRVSTTSGDKTVEHELAVIFSEEWAEHKFLKVYTRPVWGSEQDNFIIESSSSMGDIIVTSIDENGFSAQVLMIPIEVLKSDFISEIVNFKN